MDCRQKMGSDFEREIQMRMKILPPTNASKLMRRSRFGTATGGDVPQVMF
jgi:hypothetical protein